MSVENKVKVLFLSAVPRDEEYLDVHREIREIQKKIRTSDYRDAVELIPCPAVQPGDLIDHFSQVMPHVVHFSGHGGRNGEICLEDDDGNARAVSKEAMIELFRVMKDNIRLVILNACFTGSQARLVSRSIEATVGMDRAIGDEAAISFAAAFYRAIGFGKSIQRAFDEARLDLMLLGIPEEDRPVLYPRKDVDADRIFLVHPLGVEMLDSPPPKAHPGARAAAMLWREFSLELLNRIEKGWHLVVWASKYSGKPEFIQSFTTFLNRVRRDWRIITLSPLSFPNISEAEYFEDIMEHLAEFEPGITGRKESPDSTPSNLFYKTLKEITTNPESRVIVLFDSLEKSDPDHLTSIVSVLKRIADEGNSELFNLIFIGGEELHNLCYRYINPQLSPLNIAKTVFLPDPSKAESTALLRQSLPDIDERLVKEVYHLTDGCQPLLRDAIEHLPKFDGDLDRWMAKLEKEAQFFGEFRMLIKSDPERGNELKAWLRRLPDYTKELSNIDYGKLFWLGLLKVKKDAFAWRCDMVRRLVENELGGDTLIS